MKTWLSLQTRNELPRSSTSNPAALLVTRKHFVEDHENTAGSYNSLGVKQHAMYDYKAALQSHQRALAIRIKLYAEEHEATADSYDSLSVTQHAVYDYKPALQ